MTVWRFTAQSLIIILLSSQHDLNNVKRGVKYQTIIIMVWACCAFQSPFYGAEGILPKYCCNFKASKEHNCFMIKVCCCIFTTIRKGVYQDSRKIFALPMIELVTYPLFYLKAFIFWSTKKKSLSSQLRTIFCIDTSHTQRHVAFMDNSNGVDVASG